MDLSRSERALELVRDLVQLLGPYEEELISAERAAPDVAHLRRAVGMAIAEACYWISDERIGRSRWAPPKADESRSAS